MYYILIFFQKIAKSDNFLNQNLPSTHSKKAISKIFQDPAQESTKVKR